MLPASLLLVFYVPHPFRGEAFRPLLPSRGSLGAVILSGVPRFFLRAVFPRGTQSKDLSWICRPATFSSKSDPCSPLRAREKCRKTHPAGRPVQWGRTFRCDKQNVARSASDALFLSQQVVLFEPRHEHPTLFQRARIHRRHLRKRLLGLRLVYAALSATVHPCSASAYVSLSYFPPHAFSAPSNFSIASLGIEWSFTA